MIYERVKMQFKRITSHDIRITHSENGGCIVKIGCATFAFSTPDEMLEALKQFYNDPEKMEKEYNSQYGPQPEATHPQPMDYAEEDKDEERAPNRQLRREPRANPVVFDENDTNF
jgi:hypothetical protein